jgi:glycosyltransferase involved in cell wall biosynthesis
LSGRATRIAIFYPCDPVGFVPSGIDTFIRGILRWAPRELDYTLFGATTDSTAHPIGHEIEIAGLNRTSRFVPLVNVDPSARRSLVPLTIRYAWALHRYLGRHSLAEFDILDFHRAEPVALFWNDVRPKNLVMHQDMSVIRSSDSDIKWRYLPWLYERFERRIFEIVEQVFCVRQSAVQRYRSLDPGSKAQFEFIPTWVNVEAFESACTQDLRTELRGRVREELGLPADVRLLIFVGRLDRQKDPLLLVDSFQVLRGSEQNVHLLVIGDGALRSEVEKRISAGNLVNQVSLVGAQPPSRIASLLQASDVFVLSSAYEGMPIAVLEALAAGLPVVSTDVGEIRLVVKESINGEISPARTPRAMAQAISSALAKVETLRGRACVDSVRQFSPEIVLGRIYQHHRAQAGRIRADIRSDS